MHACIHWTELSLPCLQLPLQVGPAFEATATSGGREPPTYFRYSVPAAGGGVSNRVRLQGDLVRKSGATDNVVAILPIGFRPTTSVGAMADVGCHMLNGLL